MRLKQRVQLALRPARKVPVAPQGKFKNELHKMKEQDIVTKLKVAIEGKLRWLQLQNNVCCHIGCRCNMFFISRYII